MGLVLLKKGSQCFTGSVFIPFDPPTLCNYSTILAAYRCIEEGNFDCKL